MSERKSAGRIGSIEIQIQFSLGSLTQALFCHMTRRWQNFSHMTIKWMNGVTDMANVRKDEILLTGEFSLFPNEKNLYKLELRKSGITYFPLTSNNAGINRYLHFGDIIGCRCRKSTEPKYAAKAYFTIYMYPLRKKLFSGKWARRQDHVTFGRHCDSSFDGNRKVVEQWRRVIIHIAHNLQLQREDIEKCPVPPKTKLLVLVNPYSGPGKAMQIYKTYVAPMLAEADIQVKLIQTEHAGHASDMMKTISRHEWYGVVIVSGDGLIYEVINGLMSRPDWQDAIKLPVGCIPGGSGNALCCSINYSAGESIDVDFALHSTFILIKHKIVPMDLILVEQPKSRVYSFLSVTWGLLADIDYESEKYRAIGEARFTLQAIRRIMGLRVYRGKVSFLPIAKYIPKSSNNNYTTITDDIPVMRNRRVSLHSLEDETYHPDLEDHSELRTKSVPSELFRTTSLSSNVENGEVVSTNGENLTDICDSSVSISTESKNSKNTVESNMYVENGGSVPNFTLNSVGDEDSANDCSLRMNSGLAGSCNSLQDTFRMVKRPGEGVPSNLLPPLDEPVPDDWVTLDGDFVSVCAAYQTHLGSDVIMAPDAHLNDGLIHLVLIHRGVTKQQLFSLMTALEKGSHVDNPSPYVEFVKVLAFRLEPAMDKEGVIMIDGEKVDYVPLQAQVLPGIANLLAIR